MSSPEAERTPVLVGLGQSLEREAVVDVVTLAARAIRAAFEDAPGLESRVQRLSIVAASFSKVGKAVASEVAASLELADITCEVTTPGGNTPQWLMNRACEEISRGELQTTIIAGAEATRSMRMVDKDADFLSAGFASAEDEGPEDPVVGASMRGLFSTPEIEAKLYRPAEAYPIFESALAARAGRSLAETRDHIAAFYSRASQVAAQNPFAWFPEPLSAADIGQPSPSNRATAEPYTKRMNSFANVDQGAALIVTTLAIARELGLEDRCIFPHAGATNAEIPSGARPDLGASPAIRAASAAVFQAAGIGLDDVDHIDIYSCFPVAVQISAAEIGLALDDPRGLTTTGFMSFFGGPGNNYTTHGIASTAARLREGGSYAYITGNGGLLSKHSIGIYGSAPPPNGFALADTSKEQAEINAAAIDVVSQAEGSATVDGGTVVYDRNGGVASAPAIATLENGQRVVALADPAILPELAGRNLAGETIQVRGASPPVFTL